MEHSERLLQRQLIVVIHPSPTVCQVLGDALQSQGHQVWCFLDPEAAKQALFQTRTTPLPAILFLYIARTSQLTEFEVLRLCRTHGPKMSVAVICPLKDSMVQLKARLAGASVFLDEPVQPHLVMDLVRRIATRSDTSTL